MGHLSRNPVHILKQRCRLEAPRAPLLRGVGSPEPPSLKSPELQEDWPWGLDDIRAEFEMGGG